MVLELIKIRNIRNLMRMYCFGMNFFAEMVTTICPNPEPNRENPEHSICFSESKDSASQMTAAKVMDVLARLPDCAGHSRRRSIRLHPSKNGGRSKVGKKSKVRVSKYTSQVAKIMVKH